MFLNPRQKIRGEFKKLKSASKLEVELRKKRRRFKKKIFLNSRPKNRGEFKKLKSASKLEVGLRKN